MTTVTFRHAGWEAAIAEAVRVLGVRGHAVAQAVAPGDPALAAPLIEVNPRYGGASALASACGLEGFGWFLEESLGRRLPCPLFRYPELPWVLMREPATWVGPLPPALREALLGGLPPGLAALS